MSILKKLFTLGKSLVNDTEVLIEETQGIRLLEQHIRDARTELDKAGEARVDLLARAKLSKDKLNELNTRKMTLESRAVDAMQKQVDESLLLEVAEEISRLEAVIVSEEDVLQNLTHSREVVEQAVAATCQRIARFEQQLEVVKATEATQRAQQAVTTSAVGASSSMATAADSLKRIQTQQAERQARLEAAESIEKLASGRDLDEKLAQGGASTHSAQDVLARLRNQRND
ncbi:PspA/IM30 family protein [Atlantibacter hermannii]|uniref:PspA/IM30 family protein n=1 Tax=Atlantibacter hermannii TaxID=565 RepID=UPI0028A08C3F|nr:PspA/IM30 family protein [Atlantibacter hermannii]